MGVNSDICKHRQEENFSDKKPPLSVYSVVCIYFRFNQD